MTVKQSPKPKTKRKPRKTPSPKRPQIPQPPVVGTVDGVTLFRNVDSLLANLNTIDDMTAVVAACLRNQGCDMDAACANVLESVYDVIEEARTTLGEVSQMVPRGDALAS